MNVQQLEYFIEVARYLNFSKAAEHLYIGQPALSRQIAELEKELGVTLLLRDKHSVSLTAAGAVLLDHATQILNRISVAIEQTKRTAAGLSGTLNIGYISEEDYITQTVKKMHQEKPDILFSLNRYTHQGLYRALAQGDADLIVTFLPVQPTDDTEPIAYKKIRSTALCAVLPSEHPLASCEKIHFSSLRDEPFILIRQDISPQPYQITLQLCIQHGFYPKIISEQEQIESVCMTVGTGLGVSIMFPYSSCYNKNVRFVEIEDADIEVEVYVGWLRKNQNPVIPLFMEELDHLLPAYR